MGYESIGDGRLEANRSLFRLGAESPSEILLGGGGGGGWGGSRITKRLIYLTLQLVSMQRLQTQALCFKLDFLKEGGGESVENQ